MYEIRVRIDLLLKIILPKVVKTIFDLVLCSTHVSEIVVRSARVLAIPSQLLDFTFPDIGNMREKFTIIDVRNDSRRYYNSHTGSRNEQISKHVG